MKEANVDGKGVELLHIGHDVAEVMLLLGSAVHIPVMDYSVKQVNY